MATIWGSSMRDEQKSPSPVNEKGSELWKRSVEVLDSNVEIAFGWNRSTLGIVGLWPDQTCENSRANLITKYVPPIMVIWILGFVTIPQVSASIIYIFVLDELIEVIVESVGFIGVIARILAFWYNGEVLAQCISVISEDWNRKHTLEEQELMMKNAIFSRRISIGVTILAMALLGSCFFIKSLALLSLNFDNHNGTEFGKWLLATSYFPFDLSQRSKFAFALGGQFFGYVGGTIAYSSADSFVAALIIHLCGQISILRNALVRLIDHDTSLSSETFHEKLAIIVKRHNTLTETANAIKGAFDLMLLVVILVYTIELGLQLFRLLMAVTEGEPGQFPLVKVIFCVSFLNVMLVHLLGYCYIGDMLIEESESLGLASYSCEWYNLSDNCARHLMLVMHRARVPFRIWAGQFVPFSMELFTNVLKTSMGYFSLLLTIKDQSTKSTK